MTEPSHQPGKPPITVVLAGASGFVGRALAARLASGCRVIGLSRSAAHGVEQDGVTWRQADLFSLLDCERALEGADVAVYLVHSMMPSARLTQARFEDMDLILADNFARAAAAAGVKRIVYLGGLIPPDEPLSPHLASRLEVEDVLGGRGVPVTTLRAGLVIGPHGSSFRILQNLVARLPVMALPSWTRSPTQPVAVDDVVELLAAVATEPVQPGEQSVSLDIGGPETLPYAELIARTARAMGVRRLLLPVPFLSPRLSRLWVSLVTNTPSELVGPLVESLRHPMVCRSRELQARLGIDGLALDEAFARALDPRPASLPSVPRAPAGTSESPRNTVRSVQRMAVPAGQPADWVANEYLRWLPQGLFPFIRVTTPEEGCARFWLRGVGRPLLELRYAPDRSSPDRALFYVVGGLLADVDASPRGRLEFRLVDPDGPGADEPVLIAAIHDFVPTLPWFVYNLTQAQAHLAVMGLFRRHLARSPAAPRRSTASSAASPPLA